MEGRDRLRDLSAASLPVLLVGLIIATAAVVWAGLAFCGPEVVSRSPIADSALEKTATVPCSDPLDDVQRTVRTTVDDTIPADSDEVVSVEVELERSNPFPFDGSTAESLPIETEYSPHRTETAVDRALQFVPAGVSDLAAVVTMTLLTLEFDRCSEDDE